MTNICAPDGGPKRDRHYSYDKNVDESGKAIEDEATDVEHEAPLDGNEPIEGEDEKPPRPPVFED